MEIRYDSDTSEETRDLVERGLAINRRKYVSRAEYRADDQGPAPDRDMDISSVRLPFVSGTTQEEPSTRGLSLTGAENALGQILNIYVRIFCTDSFSKIQLISIQSVEARFSSALNK